MTDINQMIVTGRLVRDPILRRGTTGTMIAMFTLVTNHYYRAKSGEFAQEAAFIPCIAFARLADAVAQRMKGEPILVVGRLRTDTWEQDSERRSQLSLVCDSIRCFAGGVVSFRQPEQAKKTANDDQMPEENKNSVPF